MGSREERDSVDRFGILVRAQLPPGSTVSAETIRVIASKRPLPRYLYDPTASAPAGGSGATSSHATSEQQGSGSFLQLLHKLHGSEYEWAEDVQAFTIYTD